MRKILTASIFILNFCFLAFGQNSTCPEISVTGPPGVLQDGETATFSVSVGKKNQDLDNLQYIWSVDKGTIIEGQGEPAILVSTEGLIDTTITATVEIKGLASGCVNSFSEKGVVLASCVYIPTIDEFGKLSKNDEKARLDSFAAEIMAEKEFTAYIILYHPSKKGKKSYENRAARIRNYLVKERRIPSQKVVIISGGDEPEERTKIYLVPAGAEPPTP